MWSLQTLVDIFWDLHYETLCWTPWSVGTVPSPRKWIGCVDFEGIPKCWQKCWLGHAGRTYAMDCYLKLLLRLCSYLWTQLEVWRKPKTVQLPSRLWQKPDCRPCSGSLSRILKRLLNFNCFCLEIGGLGFVCIWVMCFLVLFTYISIVALRQQVSFVDIGSCLLLLCLMKFFTYEWAFTWIWSPWITCLGLGCLVL